MASPSLRSKSFRTVLHAQSKPGAASQAPKGAGHHSALQKGLASRVTHTPCILLRQKYLTVGGAWQCRWRHIITDSFLVVLAACFTAFTVMKVRSAQQDVGGAFWKAVREHPQLANDWAICVAQWTGELYLSLPLWERQQHCVAYVSGFRLQAWPCM